MADFFSNTNLDSKLFSAVNSMICFMIYVEIYFCVCRLLKITIRPVKPNLDCSTKGYKEKC